MRYASKSYRTTHRTESLSDYPRYGVKVQRDFGGGNAAHSPEDRRFDIGRNPSDKCSGPRTPYCCSYIQIDGDSRGLFGGKLNCADFSTAERTGSPVLYTLHHRMYQHSPLSGPYQLLVWIGKLLHYSVAVNVQCNTSKKLNSIGATVNIRVPGCTAEYQPC